MMNGAESQFFYPGGSDASALSMITEPMRKYASLATFVRGLAKNEGGRLVWDIDYEGPDSVKINGQSFPPQKD